MPATYSITRRTANTTVSVTFIEPIRVTIYTGRMGPHEIRKVDFSTETITLNLLFNKARADRQLIFYVHRYFPEFTS